MKSFWLLAILLATLFFAANLFAEQKSPQTSLKTISEVQARAGTSRENLDNWTPSPNCNGEYFEVLPASYPDSRCRDLANMPTHGKRIVHFYTCRFKNEYPLADVCYGGKIKRLGLESYSCESDDPMDISRKPCIKNYKLISEWHGDIDKDLAKNHPYGFICKAEASPAICLAPKYEYVYRSDADHCCVLYKNE